MSVRNNMRKKKNRMSAILTRHSFWNISIKAAEAKGTEKWLENASHNFPPLWNLFDLYENKSVFVYFGKPEKYTYFWTKSFIRRNFLRPLCSPLKSIIYRRLFCFLRRRCYIFAAAFVCWLLSTVTVGRCWLWIRNFQGESGSYIEGPTIN